MSAATDMKEVDLELQVPLTTQPKKQGSLEDGVAAAPQKFGYKPAQVVCQKCGSHVTTNMSYHITDFTHLTVFLCSLATWPCLMCALSGIPYCCSVCQKVEHHCPQCKSLVGKHALFRLSNMSSCLKK